MDRRDPRGVESGLRAILDSDVLIDFLQGQAKAEQELRRYADWEISVVTWMEVLSGTEGKEEEKQGRRFLDSLKVHPLSTSVAEEAVQLRKSSDSACPTLSSGPPPAPRVACLSPATTVTSLRTNPASASPTI